MKNKAYVLMGASGSGKDTLGTYFKKKGIPKLLSNTSRPMRKGEVDGKDYYFRTVEDIENMNLLNKITYADNTYGYAKDTVKAMSHRNKSFYCVATVSALHALKEFLPHYDVVGIYLDSDEKTLEKRMRERGDSEESIRSRLKFLSENQELEEEAKFNADWVVSKKATLSHHQNLANTIVKKIEKPKAYISGKMTGTEDYGREKFSKARQILMGKGYEVFSPSDIGYVDGWDWSEYMRYDLAEMTKCDIVYMLDDWKDSKGATIEYEVAKGLGIPVAHLDLKIQ